MTNGSRTAPPNVDKSLTEDILKNSITAGDVMSAHNGGMSYLLPMFVFPSIALGLPASLPPYWSYERDAVLRSTILHEGIWGGAIRIAATKAAAQSFTVEGDVPARNVRVQEMMLQWGGRGYVPSQAMGVQDFLTTDNGEFHEIVRTSSAAGSRVVGVVHLDSWRVQRTGDPEIPALYRSLDGRLHELNYWQIIGMSDMPSPGALWWGVGHCAAGDAYRGIFEMHATQTYINEKVSGSGADKLTFIKGMTSAQIQSALATGDAAKLAKGLVYYQGSVLAGQLGDQPLDKLEIQLRGLPENFARKEQLDIAVLLYANSIGIDVQDLQPLSGQGLGTGAQSHVLFEKSKGRWPARRNKELTHNINEWVAPDKTTFAFSERDLTDELKEAQVKLARAEARGAQVATGEMTPLESRALAIDQNDLPRDFLVGTTEVADEEISDEDKPMGDDAAQRAGVAANAALVPAQPGAPAAPAQAQAPATQQAAQPAAPSASPLSAAISAAMRTKGTSAPQRKKKLATIIRKRLAAPTRSSR